MSQFDLPRINFHGTALLDTSTANNGNYGPSLSMFDQDESEAFMPPRCYLPPENNPQPLMGKGLIIKTDKNGNRYVPILPVTKDNYEEWATTPLGTLEVNGVIIEEAYHILYENMGILNVNPGYWNYYGDLSMSLEDTQVLGITLPNSDGGVVTYTREEQTGCPPDFAAIFGAELSFNKNYFSPDSRTSAYLCDVDAMGQMCTQIFCGEAGLYAKDANGNETTFFKGKPVKSTSRWMNLTKTLNYSDHSLLPMGGSACFYTMLELDDSSELSKMMFQQTGKQANGLCIKYLIHQVYEVRNPDYKKLATKEISDLKGNKSLVPKNPAVVAVSGTITPWYDGDMKTTSICRLLKNASEITIDKKIPKPKTKGGSELSVPKSINLGPIQFIYNSSLNLISLDIINFINEYGKNPAAEPASYAGDSDIPAYQTFQTYKYGVFTLMFQSDTPGSPQMVGSLSYNTDYNMKQLLATGGLIDIAVTSTTNYSNGYFYLLLNNSTVSSEDNYVITSDQMGNYAQQKQANYNYMSDGLPKTPCILNVFYRGKPVSPSVPVFVTKQAINMVTGDINNTNNYKIFNGMPIDFPVDVNGCITYAFVDAQSEVWDGKMANLFRFAMNTSMVVLRTLEANLPLDKYITGESAITWQVVYENCFQLFQSLYPVMNAIIPFTEANWSDPFILKKMLMLIDESNWNQPLYMPVTRDLSAQQIQLLTLWANQIIKKNESV